MPLPPPDATAPAPVLRLAGRPWITWPAADVREGEPLSDPGADEAAEVIDRHFSDGLEGGHGWPSAS